MWLFMQFRTVLNATIAAGAGHCRTSTHQLFCWEVAGQLRLCELVWIYA